MPAVAYETTVQLVNHPDREAIAGEVRAAMARRRVTQAQLARRIGVSRTSLSERLNGAKAFNTDQLMQISQALGVPFLDLLPQPEPDVVAS